MILVNKNSKIVLDVLRAELTPKSDLLDTIDSLDYTVTFGMQVKKSSANLRHRDILNPVFNETLEFLPADSNKLVFRLFSRGVLLGEADILLASNKNLAYIVGRRRIIIGTVHYALGFSQPARELLRHTRGAESENYAGHPQNGANKSKSKIRDKSQELRPRQQRVPKARQTAVEAVHSPQLSEQLFSSYFHKKSSQAHQRQVSDGPEMQVSIDPRDRELMQKRHMLEVELQQTLSKLQQTRSSRKLVAAKITNLKKEMEQLQNELEKLPLFSEESEDYEYQQLIEEIQRVTEYNSELKAQLRTK